METFDFLCEDFFGMSAAQITQNRSQIFIFFLKNRPSFLNNATDIHQDKLTALIPVRAVNDKLGAIRTGSRVRINPPFAFIFRIKVEISNGYPLFSWYMIEVYLLNSLLIWVFII